MHFFDLVSLVFDNLGRRKGRVALTAIGVVIGTAAVIILVSLAIGLQRSATSQLYGIADLTRIEVYPNYGEVYYEEKMGGGGGGGVNTQAKLLTPQAIEEIKAIPGVRQVIARDYLQTQAILKYGKLENWGSVMGVDVDNLDVFEFPLQEGTTQLDHGTAVIGGWVAKNFYDPQLRPGQDPPEQPQLLGQTLRLVMSKWTMDGVEVKKTVNLRIVGVLAEARSEADGFLFVRLDDMTAWNEWASGRRINRNKDGYNNVIVKAESADQVLDITDQINALGYQAYASQSYVEGINSFFTILQIIFGGVGAIALLVAAIGIANTMTMAILERTREIGLMKAIGATNRDILSIFLGEAAGIGLIGGLGGVAVGWLSGQMLNAAALTYLANQAAEGGAALPSSVVVSPLWLLLFALAFSILVGLISGLYPSLRAAALVPVNALKYE